MKKLRDNYLYLTVFVNGAVVLVIEIIGTRFIAPLYGSTIYVWSSLIVVTMGALALGYSIGGKLADKLNEEKYLFWIVAAGGVSTLLIPKITNPALKLSDGLGLKFGPLLSSFIIFFIPLLILGMISPFVIKLQTKKIKDIGTEAGKIFSIATLGSLLGGLAAGFILAPLFSSVLLIVFSGILLLMLFTIKQIL